MIEKRKLTKNAEKIEKNKTEITFSDRPREIHIFKLKIFSKLSIIKTILNLKMLNNFQALRYSRSLGRVIGWGREGVALQRKLISGAIFTAQKLKNVHAVARLIFCPFIEFWSK